MASNNERDGEWHDHLIKMHQRQVIALLTRRLGTHQAHVVEDLAQKTFLTAWERRGDVPHEPAAWLARTALNHLSNHRRWSWLRRREWSAEPAPHEPADEHHAAPERVVDVTRALHRLPAADSDLLRLAYMDEYSGEELADILGITPAAVRKRLSRAAMRLRHLLGPAYLHDDHGDGEARA